MKNTLKKLTSLFMVMALALSMAVTVSAAPPNGTIKITALAGSTFAGQKVDAYRIFDLSYSADNGAYSYTLAPKFSGLPVAILGAGKTGSDLLAYLTTYKDDAEKIYKFGNDVRAYILATTSLKNSPDKTKTHGANDTATIVNFNVGTELGYYIVLASANYGEGLDGNAMSVIGTCILTSTAYDAQMNMKTDLPTIKKEVMDEDDPHNPAGSGRGWNYSTDLSIGETAQFRITSTIPTVVGYTSYTYKVHDTLSKGLTFVPSTFKAEIRDKDTNALISALTSPANYSLTAPIVNGSDTTITVTFNNFLTWAAIAAHEGHNIVITYDAVLNEHAVLADAASPNYNPNKVYLEYSNSPYASTTNKTPEETVVVYSFKAEIYKYAKIGSEGVETGLKGAKFNVYETQAEAAAALAAINAGNTPAAGISLVEISAGSASTPATYRPAKAGETGGKQIVTPENGLVEIHGLDSDHYYFVEVEAPDGFNKILEVIKVGVAGRYDSDGALDKVESWDDESGTWKQSEKLGSAINFLYFKVLNESGVKLPETGGIGTTMFTAAGSALMLAAAILFGRKKEAEVRARA